MEIKSQSDFDLLKGDPLASTFSNVSSINLTYDISEKKLYFMQSKKYRYHINFCTQVLGYNLGLELFNTYNYGNMKRREYYLAILNYYNDSKTYTLEFVSEDQINADQIKELYNDVKAKTFFGEQVKLFINNDHLQHLEKENSFTDIPKNYPADLYGTQNYQVLNAGVAIGYLKMVDDLKKDFNHVTSRDIIVIKGTVISLPVCAAVVTNSFQTPLSHINLLTHNRGIPSAAQRDIFSNKEFISRQNKLVKIFIAQDSLTITDCVITEAELFWKQSVSRKPISLTYNLKVNTVQNIEDLNSKSTDIVGSKAACFAELTKLQKRNPTIFKMPEGSFAIPFYFYRQHISQPTIASEINKLLTAAIYQSNNDSLKEQLKKIRSAIKHEPISVSLLNQVNEKIKTGSYTSFRFRSSTNIEDIEGFNGAGLYDSKTGIINNTNKSIEDAVKDVWASV
ncbi:MAG: PEP/pyruvate-binding domain-containing protein, partial [Ignavibacteria bacterium]|nr:PEP/pyruvate-binding domain-containing protein [Ignavibacteria bacterium]